MKILRHLLAIAVLPFVATVVVPRFVASSYGVRFAAPDSLASVAAFIAGVGLFVVGASLAISSVLRFFFDGDGTLAPWDPPTRFVATGPYRYVRNPMITGVFLVLCAQSLMLRSVPHAGWAGVFLLLNIIWIPLVEEPGLRARFGESYREYCRHVGRLVPRLRPYVGPSFSSAGTSTAGRKPGPLHEVPTCAAVVPAAGKSSRFGSDKRVALVDGVPMLARVVAALEAAGAARVIVVGQPGDEARLINPDPDRGMFSSIQIGLAEAVKGGVDVVLVQPADMPFVRADTIRAVIDECARTGRAVCPRHDAKRGHPLAFPAALARQLLAVDPSTPLNEAFAAIGLVRHELDVDDPGVLRDVDTKADLGLGE